MLEQDREEVPWSVQQTFLGILLTLVPWIVLSFLLSTASVGKPITRPLPAQLDFTNAIVTLIASAVIEGAFLIAPLYFAHHPFRSSPHSWQQAWSVLGFRRCKFGYALAWIILLFVAVILVNILYTYAITTFHLPLLPNDQRILEQGKLAPVTAYATLLGSVLFAPFCEEVFFRSFTFIGLASGMPLNVALVLSALIFAVAHGDPGSFLVLFVIGLALAFLRWRTRSIWPCMALHLLNNLLGALSIFLSLTHIH